MTNSVGPGSTHVADTEGTRRDGVLEVTNEDGEQAVWQPGNGPSWLGLSRSVLAEPNICRTGEPHSGVGRGSRSASTNSNSLTSSFVRPLYSPCSGPYTMPPQPGVFPLPYASTHKARANPTEIHNGTTDVSSGYLPPSHHTIHHTPSALLAGPSSRLHGTFVSHSHDMRSASLIHHVAGANIDDGKKDRRRKEIVGRLGKEMNDRRDECVSPLPSSPSHACLNG